MADRRLKIHVTAEDIRNGISWDGTACPIAKAIQRMFPFNYVEVDYETATTCHATYVLTKSAKRFVKRFDSSYDVMPSTFILREED